ncbi:hypothetical protein [Leptospira interrogans]|uniref:hypothetical protein n=1 Tax=Leptospira interrogans TaxID=173 RepID=UPI0002C038F1|nr:hypothetical protein [Leptospira interrogans]EMN38300.1 hypothetical protein LEP1GSC085_0067 [Leptospira interrogans str. L0996]
MTNEQLGASIRWHLNSGYRIERTYEILADRGATLALVTEIYEKIGTERAELARRGK